MLPQYFVIIGTLIAALGALAYLIETVKGKVKPNRVSFLPWTIGHDATNRKIWKLDEMDADHVVAWSKGGATDIRNCQMLCKTHNRAKGNR